MQESWLSVDLHKEIIAWNRIAIKRGAAMRWRRAYGSSWEKLGYKEEGYDFEPVKKPLDQVKDDCLILTAQTENIAVIAESTSTDPRVSEEVIRPLIASFATFYHVGLVCPMVIERQNKIPWNK